MQSVTIKAYTEDSKQLDAVKAFFNALKIKFEISESTYNPNFANMILNAEKDIKENKGKKVTSSEFDNLWK